MILPPLVVPGGSDIHLELLTVTQLITTVKSFIVHAHGYSNTPVKQASSARTFTINIFTMVTTYHVLSKLACLSLSATSNLSRSEAMTLLD